MSVRALSGQISKIVLGEKIEVGVARIIIAFVFACMLFPFVIKSIKRTNVEEIQNCFYSVQDELVKPLPRIIESAKSVVTASKLAEKVAKPAKKKKGKRKKEKRMMSGCMG